VQEKPEPRQYARSGVPKNEVTINVLPNRPPARPRWLFVSCNFPADPERKVTAVYRRMGMFVEALRGLGTLDMLFFVEPDVAVDAESVERFRVRLADHWETDLRLQLCRRELPAERGRVAHYLRGALSVHGQPQYEMTSGERQLAAFEEALGRRPDGLFLHRLNAAMPALRSRHSLPPIAFDLDDIEHRKFVRMLRQPPVWPGKRLGYSWLPALRRAERRAVRAARRTFVCSEEDRTYLARWAGTAGVDVVPNATEIPPPPAPASEPAMLFLGSFAYGPNQAGVEWLLEQVWPRVRERLPEARLLLAGPGSRERVGASPPEGVEALGFVSELADAYGRARVACAPILAGGGTRLKIVEAAAYGRPVVSTTLGAEGLDLREGEHLLLADDPDDFAAACVELLSTPERCSRMGDAARAFVADHYDRAAIVDQVRDLLRGVAGTGEE
jgi:glycosyltransferase involved in cell wall biosynthesis